IATAALLLGGFLGAFLAQGPSSSSSPSDPPATKTSATPKAKAAPKAEVVALPAYPATPRDNLRFTITAPQDLPHITGNFDVRLDLNLQQIEHSPESPDMVVTLTAAEMADDQIAHAIQERLKTELQTFYQDKLATQVQKIVDKESGMVKDKLAMS